MNPQREVGSTANSYEIVAKLAEGGMAEIFLARGATEAGIERYVVLKRIIRERAHDVELVQMFLDEARLAALLQHPNVAAVFDVGRLGESYFFTMEYVHGETVRAIEKKAEAVGKRIPVSVALAIASGAAAGLHHAHDRKGMGGKPLGIVHRDVSPTNLMVGYEGHVKVVDFGVAKAAGRQTTQSGTIRGKIAYLAPEQAQSQPVDRRSDLFALGIVLWELLAGERLYDRESDYNTLTAIVEEPPPPLRDRRADVPIELEALVLKLLAKDPAARFQTARDVGDEIERIAETAAIPLTTGSLARFMREWFGDKAEPWLDVEIAKHPSIVSVKSTPIPPKLSELELVEDDHDNDPLRAVPTLSVIELGTGQMKATLLQAKLPPVATLRGVGLDEAADNAPTIFVPAGAAPAKSKTPIIAIAAGLGLLGGIALVLAFVRPWEHAPAPATHDAALVAPSPPPSPPPSPSPSPSPPPPPSPSPSPSPPPSPPPDAAIVAAPPVDAAPVRRPTHPPPNHGSAAHPANDCANDPMACQH